MPRLPDISRRRREPELMDDPALNATEHARALADLRVLNLVSRTAPALWRAIRELGAGPGHRPVRVLDVATGSGDVPLRLERLARRWGIHLEIEACDKSERAVEIARSRASRAGTEIRYFTLDAIREELPGDYDVVTCSLFMHHLDEEDVVGLLYKMRAAARRMVLVSDLSRNRAGLRLAWLGTRLFSRSVVARVDAVISVCAAFTIEEFSGLAEEAGLEGASIRRCWPHRFLLQWRRA